MAINISDKQKKLANHGHVVLVNNSRKLAEISRQDIEKSFNIESNHETEAYYSNRYGWTLRRIIS